MDRLRSHISDSGHHEMPLPEGARTWAVIGSFMETCRMNDVNPLAWLTATLEKLAAGHSVKDLETLMPWNFSKAAS